MPQQQLINQLVKTIDDAITKFHQSIPGIQDQMLNDVQLLVKDLDVYADGSIKNSVKNLQIIGRIKSKLQDIVLNDNYLQEVADFTKAFDEVKVLQNKYFNSVSDEFTPFKLLDEIQKQSINSTIVSLTEAGISSNVTEYIQDILRTNITTGGNYQQLSNQLRDAIITNDKGQGALERYTRQITTDSLNQYSAQYIHAVADDLGFDWFMYIGSNLATTRTFCDALTKKKYVHRSEIPEIVKGFIDGKQIPIYKKTGLPAGMVDGTNANNFFIYRGGYNCGHQFVPVPKAVVPLSISSRISE